MSNPSFRKILTASLPLWILVLGHFLCGLFVRHLGIGVDQIDDPATAKLAHALSWFFHFVNQWLRIPMILLVVVAQIRILLGKRDRLVMDFIGGLLTVRCMVLFLMLNMLLLSHLKAGGLLLLELILFIPVITITFGWLYWRIDSAGRARGVPQIRFSQEMGALDPFDYFHIAANTLLQFEPAGATPLTRLMKTLFVIHGVMMLDIVALTLSRAVSLASGGG